MKSTCLDEAISETAARFIDLCVQRMDISLGKDLSGGSQIES